MKPSPHLHVDEVHIISLPERTDRLRRLTHAISAPGAWPLPPARIQPGVREQAPPWFASSNGAWGCRQAHMSILRSAWERGVESTLVLEDDAVPSEDFGARYIETAYRIPQRWSMVMLGGQHRRKPIRVSDNVVRCTDARRTHAYIIRLKAIPLLMRTWGTTRHHIDHATWHFQHGADTFAPKQWLVGQDAGYSDISLKENPLRFWSS